MYMYCLLGVFIYISCFKSGYSLIHTCCLWCVCVDVFASVCGCVCLCRMELWPATSFFFFLFPFFLFLVHSSELKAIGLQ